MREVPFADPDVDETPAFLAPDLDDVERVDRRRKPHRLQRETRREDEPGFVLPPSGSGERATRRRERRRSLARRNAGFALIVLVVLAVLLALVVRPWSSAGESAKKPLPAGLPATLPSSVVLVQQDPQRAAASITLLVADRSGRGGRIVFVPPATMSEIPSYGLDSVGKALALGGPSLLQVTIENLVGVGLPPAIVVNDKTLATAFQPAGPLDVDVPTRVEQTDGHSAVNVLWDSGPATIGPGDIPRFLAVRGEGNDLSRLARHQSFWAAYLARVAKDSNATTALPPELERIVRPLASGDVSYQILPVQAVDAGSGGDEVYRVRQAELDQLVAQLLPGTSAGSRVRVQVLNGTGGISASPRVAARLVPARARVVLSGNADSFAYAQTQIVFYDRSQQQAAERIRQALGTGRLVLSRQPIGVVDVTVVVGKDFNG